MNFEIVPFIKAQGDSLKELGIEIEYFPLIGKGFWGYFKASRRLRAHLKQNDYDLLHAHYTFSGWATVLAAKNIPIVLSLMGSDAQGVYLGKNKIKFKSRGLIALTFLIQPFVDRIISKSHNIEKFVFLKRKSHIVPNGVNINFFYPRPIDKIKLKLPSNQKTVLFLGSKNKTVKNFSLAQKAVSFLNRSDIALINPFPIPHDQIPQYLNAADVLVVPSFMEGSPNVVKEAMACNCPIVATDVGDIKWILGDTKGCYTASLEVEDFSDKIQMALEFSENAGRTNGFERIRSLGLDALSISSKIIRIYDEVCPKEKQLRNNNYEEDLKYFGSSNKS
ncbi:MAG: glycosyltransferase family 4 protein [Anditalea sp.]